MGAPEHVSFWRHALRQHRVVLTRPFLMQTTEVTRGAWRGLLGEPPEAHPSCLADDCPVQDVTWFEAVAYANALSARDGLEECYVLGPDGEVGWPSGPACPGYRLPTEAEWEHAARSGEQTAFPGGDPPEPQPEGCPFDPVLARVAWYCGNALDRPHPVGDKDATPWGLYDLYGNLYEWVWDWETAYQPGLVVDPLGGPGPGRRVRRGGEYRAPATSCRADYPTPAEPDTLYDGNGFRLVRSLLRPAGCEPEACSGEDDDCDGLTDEGPDGMPLLRYCYDGPPEEELLGICEAAVQVCGEDGWPAACVGAVDSQAELCNGLDDDCDAHVDDGDPGGGEACETGLPSGCADGTEHCVDAALACLPDVPPEDEVCNGLDDDCDGLTDGLEECQPLDGALPFVRELVLSDAADPALQGTSAVERAGELLEVPLVAGGRLDADVAGYWKLDGGGGSGIVGGPAGQVHGAERVPDRNGSEGMALELDGLSRVEIANDGTLPGVEAWTLCLWVRPHRPQEGFHVMSLASVARYNDGADNDSFWLILAEDRSPRMTVALDSDEHVAVSGPDPLPLGVWSHVCVVLEAQAGPLLLYVDGRQVDRRDLGEPVQPWVEPLVLGTCLQADGVCGMGQSLVGRLDEVVLLRRALSPLEVRHYHTTRADYGAVLTGTFWPTSVAGFDVSTAQASLADLRVTEHGVPVEHEVFGARPLADRTETVDPDVLAYWPLDGDATERSGRAVDGAGDPVVGVFDGDWEPTLGRFGDDNGAVRLSAGTLDTGLLFEPRQGEPFTIELWARLDLPAPADFGRTLVGYIHIPEDAPHSSLQLACGKCNTGPTPDEPCVRADLSPGRANYHLIEPGETCQDGSWHHYAAVSDPAAGTVCAYLDGRRFAERPIVEDDYNGMTLLLGGAQTRASPTGISTGAFDELVVHGVARSEAWIRARAHPLPRVRLHVRTEPEPDASGRYRYPPYRLWWGSDDLLPPEPQDGGLLGPENGYLAWWRFEEATAGRVSDWTGRGLAGLGADGGAVALAAGPLGGAVDLPADGEPLHLTVAEALVPPADAPGFTIEVVALPDGADGVLLDQTWAAGRLAFELAGGAFVCDVPHPAVAFPGTQRTVVAGEWHHLACVLDAGARQARTWLDHTLDRQTGIQTPLLFLGPQDPLVLGADTAGARSLGGRIDEVRVMSRPLTPAEMLHLEPTRWGVTPVLQPPCVMVDADGDGVGRCDEPPDCDDLDAGVFPGADELCDGADNDCDGAADEGEVCVCGGTDCPDHPLGWPGRCNAQEHCEYAPPGEPLAAEIWVPPGAFTLGAPEGEADRFDNEWPTRDVVFAAGWFIGKHEITVARYEACQSAGVCTPTVAGSHGGAAGTNTSGVGRADHPQNDLTAGQGEAFCARIGARLPSEAEWEYAATGPVHRRYPWGDAPEPRCEGPALAVFAEAGLGAGCGTGGTQPADSKPDGASYVGALDLAGNNDEWVLDCYHHDGHAGGPPDGAPWLDECTNGDHVRVQRGGYWQGLAAWMRTAVRSGRAWNDQTDHSGARCARDPLP